MNYLKHYIKLIRKAQNRTIDGYCENHHVFPISIFGKNKFVVKLSAREHYIAHALLEKIYIHRYGSNNINTKKMIHAFFMMNNAFGNGQKRYINSRLFEKSKLRFKELCTGKNSPLYGKKRTFSQTHLDNLRASIKCGKDHPLHGIARSEETKQKMRKPKSPEHGKAVSKARKGIQFTEQHIKNLSLSHLGNLPWNKGKSLSDEHREKISNAHKNKDLSYITEDYKKKIAESVKRSWEKRKNKLAEVSHAGE